MCSLSIVVSLDLMQPEALGSGLPSVAGFYRQLFQMAKR